MTNHITATTSQMRTIVNMNTTNTIQTGMKQKLMVSIRLEGAIKEVWTLKLLCLFHLNLFASTYPKHICLCRHKVDSKSQNSLIAPSNMINLNKTLISMRGKNNNV